MVFSFQFSVFSWKSRHIAAAACAVLTPQVSDAGMPSVQFDVATMVACRDVTTVSFAEANPDERLVEVRLVISSLLRSGSEDDLVEYFFVIDSPERAMLVEDYLPKTTLATDVVGSIGVERKDERIRTIGLDVSTDIIDQVKATAAAKQTKSKGECVHFNRLPALDLLSASGTMNRGAAAYFKLKPSSQSSLEGAKEFVLVLRVPAGWRGDYIRVQCDAVGYDRGVVRQFDQRGNCGRGEFFVALYAEGDLPAKQAAAQLVAHEQQLRDVVATSGKALRHHRYPSPVHKLGSMFSVVEPKFPAGWFDGVMQTSAEEDLAGYARHLPADVRTAAEDYQKSKQQLHILHGGQ